MYKEYILMALRDLKKRKGRTFLTSLGITIGTMLIVIMVSLGGGVKNFMESTLNNGNQAKKISIQPYKYVDENNNEEYEDFCENMDNYSKVLDDNFISKLKDNDNIESIKVYSQFYASKININNENYVGNVLCNGYLLSEDIFTKDEIEDIRTQYKDNTLEPIKSGRNIESKTGEILVGENILNSLNLKEDEILNKELKIIIPSEYGKEVEKSFIIVGIIGENFENASGLVLSIEDVSELIGYENKENNYLKNNGYDSVSLITNNISNVESVCNYIKDLDYLYSSNKESAKSVNDVISSINLAFVILGIIVFIVASIGIVNTMSMAVTERTKNIGIMKAIGADSGAIRTIFLVQSSLIGFIGGSVGIILALGINKLIEFGVNAYIESNGLSLAISIGLPGIWILLILLGASILALISGIFPANMASKLDPIEAIRK